MLNINLISNVIKMGLVIVYCTSIRVTCFVESITILGIDSESEKVALFDRRFVFYRRDRLQLKNPTGKGNT